MTSVKVDCRRHSKRLPQQITQHAQQQWQFWIDREGTFTDIVAKSPQGQLHTHKLLSENPEHYQDAAIRRIRDVLELDEDEDIPASLISSVKMGTTVGTNALLEHKGERTGLFITRGFRDLLLRKYIGQVKSDLCNDLENGPDIFFMQSHGGLTNAEESVRRVIDKLENGGCQLTLDNQAVIRVVSRVAYTQPTQQSWKILGTAKSPFQ